MFYFSHLFSIFYLDYSLNLNITLHLVAVIVALAGFVDLVQPNLQVG